MTLGVFKNQFLDFLPSPITPQKLSSRDEHSLFDFDSKKVCANYYPDEMLREVANLATLPAIGG